MTKRPTVRPSVRPHHRNINVKQLNQQVLQPSMQLEFIWREIAWPPASCEAETTEELIKTKTESGNCLCIRVF